MTAPARRHLQPVPTTGPQQLHGTDLPGVPNRLFFAEFDEDDPRQFIVDFEKRDIYIRAELTPLAARRVWAAALTHYVTNAPAWVDDTTKAGWTA